MVEYRAIADAPGYRVGSDGSVWSCRVPGPKLQCRSNWKLLRQYALQKTGYLKVTIHGRRQVMVHRLVLETFVGPCPKGKQGCHYDGVNTNNSLSNLRWDTPSANQQDSVRHGTRIHGSTHPHAVLNESEVECIRHRFSCGASINVLAKEFFVTPQNIRCIVTRRGWRHV